MTKNEIKNEAIESLNFSNYFNAVLDSHILGPLPVIKRFSHEDTKKMIEYGFTENGLREGQFVVIRRVSLLI